MTMIHEFPWHEDGYTISGVHQKEEDRLKALYMLKILDTAREEMFDKICECAAIIFDSSQAFISLVDEDRVWFKSSFGCEADQTTRQDSLCSHVVTLDNPLVVPNTLEDKRFEKNPEVTPGFNGFRIIFYAACPLRDPDTNLPIGTLCVCDNKAKPAPEPWRMEILNTLSKQLAVNLKLRMEKMQQESQIQCLEIRENQLKQEKEDAEQMAKKKTEFLSSMSHEIRTPINAVIGMADLLLETKLSELQTEYAEVIGTSSRALLQLVNDILDFSKIEQGKLELDSTCFSLIECVEAAIDQVSHAASKKNLDLGYLIDPTIDCENIQGDSMRIQQILMNFLSNAVKFTEKGEVRVTIDRISYDQFMTLTQGQKFTSGIQSENVIRNHTLIEKKNSNGELLEVPLYLQLSVRDTGIGLTQEQIDKLFKAYSQAEKSIARKYGGTGLGLLLCKTLSELMQGTCWVNSTKGEGSTFSAAVQLKYNLYKKTERNKISRSTDSISMKDRSKEEIVVPKEKFNFALAVTKGNVTSEMISNMLLRNQCFCRTTNNLDAMLSFLKISNPAFRICFIDAALLESLSNPSSFFERVRQLSPGIYLVLLYLPQHCDLRKKVKTYVDAAMLRCLHYKSIVSLLDRFLNRRKSISALGGGKISSLRTFSTAKPKYRILLAEDNKMNQLVAKRMLSHLGFSDVDIVENGELAVQRVLRNHYDLVLMDVQMPVMDGLEATRRIRSNPKIKNQPFIVSTTAGVFQDEIHECLQAGMNSYLCKPVTLKAMKALLEERNMCNPDSPCR